MDDPITEYVNQTGEIPEWFYGAGECEEFGEDDEDEYRNQR